VRSGRKSRVSRASGEVCRKSRVSRVGEVSHILIYISILSTLPQFTSSKLVAYAPYR